MNSFVALNTCKQEVSTQVVPLGSPKLYPYTALEQKERYIIVGNLQNSLFGSVFLAWDKSIRKSVIIKISRLDRVDTHTTRNGVRTMDNVYRDALMHAEIQFLRQWNNDTTNTNNNNNNNTKDRAGDFFSEFIESFFDDHYHYLITEFNPCGDLYNQLCSLQAKKMPVPQVRKIVKQLCMALNWLHSKGIVHLDISLENMCTDAKEDLKIIDFGICSVHPKSPYYYGQHNNNIPEVVTLVECAINEDLGNFLCHSIAEVNDKPGKAGYMSPELNQGKNWDAYKNDTWCIGVITYMLSTGKPPFSVAGHFLNDDGEESINVWYEVIITGQWLKPHITRQLSAYVYRDLDPQLLDFIDKILKPESERLTLKQILEHPFLSSADK